MPTSPIVIYNNKEIFNQLTGAFAKGKLHHANLISSGAGEEGMALALSLAKVILCSNRNGCGNCPSCKQADKLEHPDLHLSFPIVSGGTSGTTDDFVGAFRKAILANPFLDPNSWQQHIASKNQQLQIPVKEIQNIHHKLSLTAAGGKNRILLVWMPEQIKSVASNKLLKLIEEPLPNTYILLVTHRKGKLLPTIVSRCAPWQLRPIDSNVFATVFQHLGQQETRLLEIVFCPNLGAALESSQNLENTQIELFANWMRTCYKGNPVEITEKVSELSSLPKETLKTLLFRAQHFLERGFYHNVQSTPSASTDLGAINVQKLSSAVIPRGAQNMSTSLNECLYDLERNIHVKTSLTYASYQLHRGFRGL